VITIGEGQQLAQYDLLVPPLPLEDQVSGVVLWANGQPATNASLGYGGGADPISYRVKIDEQGRFSFKAYNGMKLALSAAIYSREREISSE
jgi:hypothetical protein